MSSVPDGFGGSSGGKTEEKPLLFPVVRQVLAPLQEPRRRQLFLNMNEVKVVVARALEFFDRLAARGVTQITVIESVHVAAYCPSLRERQ